MGSTEAPAPPAIRPLEVPADTCQDLEQALRREWLETNGLGSFACGTVACAATRRYHALLCAATRPPLGRMVLVNNVEQSILDGTEEHQLGTNLYQGGAVYPQGYRALAGFRLDPWPVWTWRVGAVTIERELFMLHGVQATVMRWRVRGGRVGLMLRPLLSGRDYHAIHHENQVLKAHVAVDGERVSLEPYPGDVPVVHLHHNGRYTHQPDWYRHFSYPVERERGLEHEEDLWAPGELRYTVGEGEVAELVLTTEGRRRFDLPILATEERRRRARLAVPSAGVPDGGEGERGAGAGEGGGIAPRLRVAADQFLVARTSGSTVIAGYPWFTDWGRDTFIALPGLTLVTGRHEVARELFLSFAPWVSEGMIPNRFPDAGETPDYNTVDASLWYVAAAGQYLAASGDHDLALRLWPTLRAIVDGYRAGTRYLINVATDGLVWAGVPGVQLTWMDAKIDDWVVTPRIGKPVEIQALWIRALHAAAAYAGRAGEGAWQAEAVALARKAGESLGRRFWHEAGGYLHDVVDGPNGDDASLRPNQLHALALDPPVIERARAERALDAVERSLLTPVGLRSLAPSDKAYRGRITGAPHERDAAYHQGTVWPHLLGVYADAVRAVRGEKVGRRIAAALGPHLLHDAGLGQVSEIFDGDAPHEPRGCFAQAWGVAELLRLALEEEG